MLNERSEKHEVHADLACGIEVFQTLGDLVLQTFMSGKSIGGGRERVRAGRGTYILPQIDHQQITKLVRLCGPQLYEYYYKSKHKSLISLNVQCLKTNVRKNNVPEN